MGLFAAERRVGRGMKEEAKQAEEAKEVCWRLRSVIPEVSA